MTEPWEEKYIKKRKSGKRRYRLLRRVSEATSVIKKYCKENNFKLLEIGSGDGLFLSELHKNFPSHEFFGIEPVRKLLDLNENESVKLFQASVEELPFTGSFFDIIVIPATIEHVKNTDAAMEEIKRVLKPPGLLIITWPNPFWDRINEIFVDTGHCRRFTFFKMRRLLSKIHFDIIKQYGFMPFPFCGIPFQRFIEKVFRFCKLDFVFFNYLAAAKRR